MRYVIIGGGAAGVAAAQGLRRLDGDGEITIVSAEEKPGYYRPLIPHLITDKFSDERLLRPPGLFSELKATALSPAKAESIDIKSKVVTLSGGDRLPYDKLLLATGSQAIVPGIKGLAARDLFTLRTWADGVRLAAAARSGQHAVVIGGGRVGIKIALALRSAGMEVTVVEMLPHILPGQFDAVAASMVLPALTAREIAVLTGRQVKEVIRRGEPGGGAGRTGGGSPAQGGAVVLDDGRELPCDLLAAAVGVRPDLELARAAGARIDRGIVVNQSLKTSLPDVFAAGDVLQLADVATGNYFVSGTWTNAVDTGRCAASNMAGVPKNYAGSFAVYNAVEIAGIPTVAVGVIDPKGPEYEVHAHRSDGIYRKFVFQGNRLAGMLLVGDIDRAGLFKTLIRERTDITRTKADIIGKTLSYAAFLRSPAPPQSARV